MGVVTDDYKPRCEYFGEAGEPNAEGQTCEQLVTKAIHIKVHGEETVLFSCTEHEREFAQEPEYIRTEDYVANPPEPLWVKSFRARLGARFRFVGNILMRDERPANPAENDPEVIDADVVTEEGEA